MKCLIWNMRAYGGDLGKSFKNFSDAINEQITKRFLNGKEEQ